MKIDRSKEWWMAKARREGEITGVWLVREGNCAVVMIEQYGQWFEIIREHYDGAFSHIKELRAPTPPAEER